MSCRSTDETGGEAVEGVMDIHDWHATVLHAMGIPLDPATENSGVARPLTSGKPIYDIFG